MPRRWLVLGAAVAVATGVVGVVFAVASAKQVAPAATEPITSTARVERGSLSAAVSLAGTLTYRARSDRSPYLAINRAAGTYTSLPEIGAKVGCGDELYRVDDRPVLLLCGTVPAYRDLHAGAAGNDVRQLNTNLHALGYDAAAGVDLDPADGTFTEVTVKAVEKLQSAKGLPVTGDLAIDRAVFLPEPARIAEVAGELGGSAQPGAVVLRATSDQLEVRADLEGSQQSQIKAGDRAQIVLPSRVSVTGRVERVGTVAQAPLDPNGKPSAAPATIPVSLALDDARAAGGLDQAPVQIDITTEGVDGALSVPVLALVGRPGGGYSVEAVRGDGRRELVEVKLGLFDTTAGRVQIDGDVHEGDPVVVPSP